MAVNPVISHLWGSCSMADGFISLGNDLAGAIKDKDFAGVLKATASIVNTVSVCTQYFISKPFKRKHSFRHSELGSKCYCPSSGCLQIKSSI